MHKEFDKDEAVSELLASFEKQVLKDWFSEFKPIYFKTRKQKYDGMSLEEAFQEFKTERIQELEVSERVWQQRQDFLNGGVDEVRKKAVKQESSFGQLSLF